MAEKSIVSNSKLIAIADAIREKTGGEGKLTLDECAIEINNIQTGINPSGTLEVTTNGLHDVASYEKVDVNVQSGSGGGDTLKALLDYTKSTSYMFYNNATITDLGDYIKKDCTENVTTMSYMFQNCSALTTIPEMDTGKVTDMYGMFYNCSSLTTIPELNTSNVTTMGYTFYKCAKLTTIPEIDTSKVNDMNKMFYGCEKLTTIPKINTGNVTNMMDMFYGCSALTTIPKIDTGNATTMSNMFYNCVNLTTISEIDTSKVVNMIKMFYGCSALTTIPKIDTSNATTMSNMFYNCTSLTTIPEMDTSKVNDMSSMFKTCTSLKTIPEMDTSKVTNMSYMFQNCAKLTNLTLYNIKTNLQIGSKTSYGTLLTQESLINTCKECVKQRSARTLTVSSASKTILDSVYVRFTDSSVTTIAVDEKGDVEVCESTDSGAMTIAAYMTLKSWALKA